MPPKAKPKVISDRTWQGRQSWEREVIESIDESRFRYHVKVDAYDFQSYAKAEVWMTDGESGSPGWRQVHRIPGQELRAFKRISYVSQNVSGAVFDADLVELRRVAQAVV